MEEGEANVTPSQKQILTDPGHFIAFGFGAGLSPFAPGTMGSIVALPLYFLLHNVLPIPLMALTIVAGFAIGVPICNRTGRWIGQSDHGGIVWDEIIAMWLVLYFVPFTIWGTVAALVAFRFFDIVKPWPISIVDAKLKNGFGVMLDDLLAALFSIASIWVLQRAIFVTIGLFSGTR